MDSTQIVIDTLSSLSNSPVSIIDKRHWFEILLDNNPGIVNIFLTGVILPVAILFLTNRNNRKLKQIEKELDIKYNSKEDLRTQEKAVYAALSKILFDVQQLHVELSGTCVDEDCIVKAVEKFDVSVTKYHEEISNNMLYMPSKIIDDIYRFYKEMSDLKIRLNEFNNSKNFEMAHVLVYYSSRDLAQILIDIQDRLLKKRTDLEIEFDRTQQEMMMYCCGDEPPQELIDKYHKLLEVIGASGAHVD